MAKIGYARVSTDDQHPEVQTARLEDYGCEQVFIDHGVSGAKASRPQWDQCLAYLRPEDSLVCIHLDRIGRSVRHVAELVAMFQERKIILVALDQGFDTSTPTGRFTAHILVAMAEMERELIRERTRNGLKATKKRGRHGGQKPRLTPEQVQLAQKLHADGWSVGRIQDTLANGGKPIGRTTIYRALGMTSEEAAAYTLTREQAVKARDLHAQGFSVEYIQKALTVEDRVPSEIAIRHILPTTDRSATPAEEAVNAFRPWKPADLEIVKRKDLNDLKAAEILGRTVRSVQAKRAQLSEQEKAS
jgi:DNA invertase Pin-like site-specific DNA recombinase